MATPHNEANEGDIAKIVLMPGDPLRAKYIAETYFEDAVCYNTIRNSFGYTGKYKGVRLSVQASGMGCPSMGIYSHELYNAYDVDLIIRIGSAGAISDALNLGDIVVAMGICTDSAYALQYKLPGTFTPIADFEVLKTAVQVLESKEYSYHVGTVLCSDVFYTEENKILKDWKKVNALCVEMESMALYCNATRSGKKALSMFTISDCPLRGEAMAADMRRTGFTKMIEASLEMAIKFAK